VRVNEVFYSIQGEGVNQGLPTVFVRLQGCNLHPGCTYCDTDYARENGGTEYTTDGVVAKIVSLSPSSKTRVCITGGEPLLQVEGLEELVATLNKFNYYLEVFTNGSLPKPFWWTRVHSWAVDIKTPSSGVKSTCGMEWLDSRVTDQIKLTVGTKEDLDFASAVIRACATKSPQIVVSPITGVLVDKSTKVTEEYWTQEWLQEVVEFCLEKRVRFSLQWHKIVWGNRKGV